MATRRDVTWNGGFLAIVWAALTMVQMVPSAARAQSISFEKIAASGTAVPGWGGTFTHFRRQPSLDGGRVAFVGFDQSVSPPHEGLYIYENGGLRLVADRITVAPGQGPGETKTFLGFGGVNFINWPSLSGANVAFHALQGLGSTGVTGIYAATPSSLDAITRFGGANSPCYSTSCRVGNPSLDGGTMAFMLDPGHFFADTLIVEATLGGNYPTLSTLVASGEPVPDGAGTFTGFTHEVSLDGDDIAFVGAGTVAVRGLYARIGGVLQRIADTDTEAPGRMRNFFGFVSPSLKDGKVAFGGRVQSSTSPDTIYLHDGSDLVLIADRDTPYPDTALTFSGFGDFVSFDGDRVAFTGGVQVLFGIFVSDGNSITKVIDTTDTLDGRQITSVGRVDIGPESVSGNAIAFWVRFADASEGIYVATLEDIPGNQAPVALCNDVTVPADAVCRATASVDAGSFDPEGDPLSLASFPESPYPFGDTLVELTATDSLGAVDTCTATVTVVDETPPQIQCNTPVSITPPEQPISFTATASDNCDVSSVNVNITQFECVKAKKDRTKDKSDACAVDVDADTISVLEAGAGWTISWVVEARDSSRNVASANCSVEIVKP